MKNIIIILLSITLLSCSKYQVVSKVRVDMYHLHNPKTKDAEIIVTKDSLIIGKLYKLKQINIENDNRKNKKHSKNKF
jgi:hypothetical protein